MAALRVLLDTNVLVSGLAYPSSAPGRIVVAWRQAGLDVALSRCFSTNCNGFCPGCHASR